MEKVIKILSLWMRLNKNMQSVVQRLLWYVYIYICNIYVPIAIRTYIYVRLYNWLDIFQTTPKANLTHDILVYVR